MSSFEVGLLAWLVGLSLICSIMQQIRLKEEEIGIGKGEGRAGGGGGGEFVVIYSTFQIDLEAYLCATERQRREDGRG